MGLAYETVLHLIALRRSGRLPDRARVIEIGAQQLSNSFLRADAPPAELYGLFGRKPVDLGAPQETTTIDGIERQAEWRRPRSRSGSPWAFPTMRWNMAATAA